MLQMISAEGGKRRAETGADEVLPFEERILAAGLCRAALPAVILTVGGKRLIRYDVTGYLPFADYPFRSLDSVLGVLYEIPLLLLDAEDCMLRADKFAPGAETLFVEAASLRPGLLYGAAPASPEGFLRGYEALLALCRTWDHITGLPDAARRIEERIGLENPDLGRLLRIVETVRREWNYIHPAAQE
jgi:hypothetical protein